MQIKIEIDLKPEELRRFLGLPDVAGLQEDLMQFLKEKVAAAGEGFDPATFVKDNLEQILRSRTVRRILYGVEAGARGRRKGRRGHAAAPPERPADDEDQP